MKNEVLFLVSLSLLIELGVACQRAQPPSTRVNPDDYTPDGYYRHRSKYEGHSNYVGQSKKFRLPLETEPRRRTLNNGSQELESCRTSPMFGECDDRGCTDPRQKWTYHTGQECFLISCIEEVRCSGIHCQCCEKILCHIQETILQVENVDAVNITVKNCTRQELDYPCIGRCDPIRKDKLETFLNASCGVVSCEMFHICEEFVCECCELTACFLRPNISENLDFKQLPSDDQSLVDLADFYNNQGGYQAKPTVNPNRFNLRVKKPTTTTPKTTTEAFLVDNPVRRNYEFDKYNYFLNGRWNHGVSNAIPAPLLPFLMPLFAYLCT